MAGGCVRLLGAGGDGVGVSLDDPLGTGGPPPVAHALIIAHDAVGGFFAVNGGGLPGETGHVLYLQPDSLTWLSFERSHEAWLQWLFEEADLGAFYGDLRWPGWEADVRYLPADRTTSSPLPSSSARRAAGPDAPR